MKKFFASLLAVMLLASMLVLPASAAGEYTITINGTATGHTYQAYQIFAGNLSSEGVLSDIVWGTGVNGSALVTALKADTSFGEGAANVFSACTTAADVAKVVSAWSPDSATLDRFAEVVGANKATAAGTSTNPSGTTYTIVGLDAGYYLVMDAATLDENIGDAYTKYIIRVVRNVEVSPKGAVPTVTKAVHTAMDGTFKEYEDVTMSYDVYFKLEGTLPSNYVTDYAQYSYEFVDTLPAGLTYNNSVSAFILHSTDATTDIDPAKYTVEYSETATGSTIITIDFGDLKATDKLPTLLASDKIVVKYAATLNSEAVIGGDGNINRVELRYSNDPNEPADETEPSMGTTASDTAKVYTYQLDVTKVDGIDTNKTLAGGKFRLYRNDTDALGVTTKRYAVVTNGVLTDSTTVESEATILESNDSGQFSIAGLDAGIYYLEETQAPSGYNKMEDPVRVTISPEYSGDSLTALKYEVDGVPGTGNHNTGVVSVQVKNNAGATLPSTGGMGTTLFYLAGAALMVGAVVVFFAKKRTDTTK